MQRNNIDNSNYLDESDFFVRPFEEVAGGYYDDKGFYCTPEGSFWDDEGVYFNRLGRDKNGGWYDNFDKYNPGEDWNEEFQCYNSEIGVGVENVKEILNQNTIENLIQGYEQFQHLFADQEEYNEYEEIEKQSEDEIMGAYVENHINGNAESSNVQDNSNLGNENLNMHNISPNNFSHNSSVNNSNIKVSIKQGYPNKSGLNFTHNNPAEFQSHGHVDNTFNNQY
jgi:hypothetical protein